MNKLSQITICVLLLVGGAALAVCGRNYAEDQYNDRIKDINRAISAETSNAIRSMNIARTEQATRFVDAKADEVIEAAKERVQIRDFTKWIGMAIAGVGLVALIVVTTSASREKIY